MTEAGAAGRRWWAAFLGYAALLAAMTHWPKLEVPGPATVRTDLIVHVGAFALWAWLLHRAWRWGASGRGRAEHGPWLGAVGVWCVSAAYSMLDEWTQAIPALGRHASWPDAIANLVGVTVGVASSCAAAALRAPRAGVP